MPPTNLLERNSRKPYLEWVRGRFYEKMSPSTDHSRLQIKLGSLLLVWGEALGFIASENDTDVAVAPPDVRRYLPDVGFWSLERLRALDRIDAGVRSIPPDLAIEILSPGAKRRYLDDKVRAYLGAGSTTVIVVDPLKRTFLVRDRSGSRLVKNGEIFTDAAFPGLRIELESLFALLDLR